LLSAELGRPPLLCTLSYFAGIIGLSSSILLRRDTFPYFGYPILFEYFKTRVVMDFSYFGEKGLKMR
jgi:hypothetical protein